MRCWVCEQEFFFSKRDALDKARRDQAGQDAKVRDLHLLAFERKELTDKQRSEAVWAALQELEGLAIDMSLLLEEASAGARGVCGYCFNASHAASGAPFEQRMEELRYSNHRYAIGQESRERQRARAARLDTPPAS